MEEKCCICQENISGLSELDRLLHMDKCLDNQLEKTIEEVKQAPTQKYEKPDIKKPLPDVIYDYTGMPDYDHMSVAELKKHLDDYGMKKTIDTKLARVVLKETWLYINQNVFPSFLNKYL